MPVVPTMNTALFLFIELTTVENRREKRRDMQNGRSLS